MTRKKTKEEFIQQAREVHGVRYNYTKFVYSNSKKKSIVICREHGEFLQTPSHHTEGSGCPKCGRMTAATKLIKPKEEFLCKARKKHEGVYDYSKFKYIDSKTKGIIICALHGVFQQAPIVHVRSGCPKCFGSKIKTKTEFIQQAREVHGNTYDYSKFEYVTAHTKSLIICKHCYSEFNQTPSSHYSSGCPECSGTKKLTHAEFLVRARATHGDRYDYTRFVYENRTNRSVIICLSHGEFQQSSAGHISQRQGCPDCGRMRMIISQSNTKEEFIQKSKAIHGDTYDYSKFIYGNAHTQGTIICKHHGDFEQTPNSHLSGCGCVECGRILTAAAKLSSTQAFIQKAKAIHGDTYDYNKYVYVNANTKGTITCKRHGDFEQTPNNHLRYRGCPMCTNKTEGIFKNYLMCNKDRLGIVEFEHGYRPEWANLNKTHNTYYIYDFVLHFADGLIVIVEIDGPQHFRQVSNWNGPLYNQIRDEIKERLARSQGIRVLRLIQEDIFNDKNDWQQQFESFTIS